MNEVKCPICGGPCWDNRESKRNPRAPDWKCKDRNCDGAIWPERKRAAAPAPPPAARRAALSDDRLTQAALRIATAVEQISAKLAELKWTAPLSKEQIKQFQTETLEAYEPNEELDAALDNDALRGDQDDDSMPF